MLENRWRFVIPPKGLLVASKPSKSQLVLSKEWKFLLACKPGACVSMLNQCVSHFPSTWCPSPASSCHITWKWLLITHDVIMSLALISGVLTSEDSKISVKQVRVDRGHPLNKTTYNPGNRSLSHCITITLLSTPHNAYGNLLKCPLWESLHQIIVCGSAFQQKLTFIYRTREVLFVVT